MNVLMPLSPFLKAFPEPDQVTPELLLGCGHAVSAEHMTWLLKHVAYFVEHPVRTNSAMEAERFHTYTTDKKYLLRVYRIADFLCLPEEVLNSIALAVLECFFFSADWSAALLDYAPLEDRVQKLWGTFVSDFIACTLHRNSYTREYDYWYSTVNVYHGCRVQLNMGDLHDVFGRQGRALVSYMRAAEKEQVFTLAHYIYEHEHLYTMRKLVNTMNLLCVRVSPACADVWTMQPVPVRLPWLRKHLRDTLKEIGERNEALATVIADGHNPLMCSAVECLDTHYYDCDCRIHREDYDPYETDW